VTVHWNRPGTIAPPTRRAGFFVLCMALVGALAAAGWYLDRQTAAVIGPARAIDGDSLVVAGVEIRLFGIDAPEFAQTCSRGGRPWNCGREAADALRAMTAGREIVCRPRDRDRYGRTVAVCLAGGLDLGAAMVKGGLAVAYGAYAADEREARDARRGIWSSTFEPPAAWRARQPRQPRQ
jgi:endonuclease YncB( thermonuclease family)